MKTQGTLPFHSGSVAGTYPASRGIPAPVTRLGLALIL
jgi:hypothetical protein